jgi:hypothetical protein
LASSTLKTAGSSRALAIFAARRALAIFDRKEQRIFDFVGDCALLAKTIGIISIYWW